MFLLANKNWQIEDALFNLVDGPDALRFSMVELLINVDTFIVEIDLADHDEDDDFINKRIVCTMLFDAIELTTQDNVVKHRISVISPCGATQEGEYAIKNITEIFRVKITDENEGNRLIYRFSDGTEVHDLFEPIKRKYEIIDCLYTKV